MIEKSKHDRLKLFNDTNIDMSFKASTQQNSPRGTGTVNSSQIIFEETIRDEVLTQLRRQLDDERKKNRDMKQIFDETMQNMEAQSRQVPTQAIEMQATKAVDEIISMGAVTQTELKEQLER